MKPQSILFISALAITSCGNTDVNTKTEQDKTAATAPISEIDSATKSKNYMECMMPGNMHVLLARDTGIWNTEMIFEVGQGNTTSSKGRAEIKMILGGRYKHMTQTGEMMGMPFEGIGISAYDNAKKMFIDTWVDNMGTGVMVLEGNYNEANNTMELKGQSINPETRAVVNLREVMKYPNDSTMIMEMYSSEPGGNETKSFEIRYTKAK